MCERGGGRERWVNRGEGGGGHILGDGGGNTDNTNRR